MANFSSDKVEFKTTPERVFRFLEDINNLGLIMPEQVENWKSDGNECSFFIKNLGDLGVKKGRLNLPGQIHFPSVESSKVKFDLVFSTGTAETGTIKAGFEISAEMSALVEMMAKRPLTNFVNLLTGNLKSHIEDHSSKDDPGAPN
jgi:hypothetical protein